MLQPIELLLFVCRRMTDLNRRTYENVTGILKSMSGAAKFVRVDVTPEKGLPELTADTWRVLRAKLPGSTHFKVSEARLVLRKLR